MTDILPASGTPRPASLRRPAAALALVALVAAACSSGATSTPPGGTGGPTTPPVATPTPPADGLQHPTGATDIVLRLEEGGGFVPIEFMATNAPSFTLYGDGTVVFRDNQAVSPEPVNNVFRSVPFLTVQLGEEGIQALLEEALGPGGLGIAVGPYDGGMVADIGTSTFTISVGGRTKEVSVVGLNPEMHPQNTVIVGSLARFAERLRLFANDVGGEQPYVPTAYRGILMPVDQPFGPVVDWPWPNIEPDDFKSDENEFFLTRVMTPAEIESLGIPGATGGFHGVAFEKDDKVFNFALRPLLPDETS